MRTVFLGYAAVLAICPAAPAAEAVFTPLPIDLPPSLADDVEAAHKNALQADLPCGADTLRATLRIDAIHPDPKWAPAVRIGLNEEGTNPPGGYDPDKLRVSLVLGAVNLGEPLKFELYKMEGNRMLDQMLFPAPGALGKAFHVEATWSANGVVHFSIDGQPLRTISLDHAPKSAVFLISGAKGEIGDIQAGRAGPAPAACAASAPSSP